MCIRFIFISRYSYYILYVLCVETKLNNKCNYHEIINNVKTN